MTLLRTENLTKYFGGLCAVNSLDLQLNEGEILGLIGPNGAGKTTVFNLISGCCQPTKGRVLFGGKDIAGRAANEVARLGIGRTFQLTSLFGEMTPMQNVLLGLHLHSLVGFWNGLVNPIFPSKRKERQLEQKANEILDFVGVVGHDGVAAKNLPYVHKKSLGCAIALAIEPKVLLLDEPMSGLSGDEMKTMISLIRNIREQGVSVMLIEHRMRAVMDLCERIVVLDFGKEIGQGSPSDILANGNVIKAYLGSGDDS